MKTKIIPSTLLRASLSTLALGLFLAASAASAQIPYVGQIQYGVKAGINVASVSGGEIDEDFEGSPRLGIGAGVAVRYHFSPSLAVQGEAQFSQKGRKIEDVVIGGVTQDATVQLDYIEIPILARYAVPLSPLMTTGIFAGPSVGIPVNAKLSGDEDSQDLEDVSMDYGLNVGVDIGSGPFYVDGRYNFGLTEIAEDSDSKNRHFQFTFGYWF